jgi:hypothetical protein
MRYKKNFYYTNIEHTNNMVDGFVGENQKFAEGFNTLLKNDFSTAASSSVLSVIEFGCDLGNRIDNIDSEIKMGIEFDQVADLYSEKYMKSPRVVFQTPEDFLSKPFPYKEKYVYGFCLDLFDIFDENYDSLVEKMLEYCDVLYLLSKNYNAREMADKLTSENIDYSECYGDDSIYAYNILFIHKIEGKDKK